VIRTYNKMDCIRRLSRRSFRAESVILSLLSLEKESKACEIIILSVYLCLSPLSMYDPMNEFLLNSVQSLFH
jgi:hypothetical protein